MMKLVFTPQLLQFRTATSQVFQASQTSENAVAEVLSETTFIF